LGFALVAAEDVAKAIFIAATDGEKRLRCLGAEQFRWLVVIRRETLEMEYRELMRSTFAPN
jgi:hypothetical protein